MVELRILGSLLFNASDGRSVDVLARHPKRTALLAYLSIARPRGPQRRDTLHALFWPEADAAHARAALSQALYVLRTILGAEAILPRGDDEVAVNESALWCDAAAFESALDAGLAADALALYRGHLLEGFHVSGAPDFERWLERERARLRERAADGAWTLAEARAAEGLPIEAHRWAQRAADLLPADEAAARRLMAFLSQLGDRAGAVSAYQAFEKRLAEEYELAPSAETRTLAASIRQDPGTSQLRPLAVTPGTRRKSPMRRNRLPAAVAALALVAALGFAAERWQRRGDGEGSHEPRVLVLPFRNLGSPGDTYFADGITDEVTSRLATVKGLSVIGGQASLRYKGTVKTPRQLRTEVGADYVLEGTVSWERGRGGVGRVRVRPRLLSASNETQVWAEVMDADMSTERLFPLLSGLTERVVEELHVALAAPQRQALEAIPTRSVEAYDYYLRGRTFARGAWLASGNKAAIDLLERAVQRDTTFALAYAWLAFSHVDAQWLYSMGARHLDLAKQAADKALRLAPDLPDVHMALGHYYYACCNDYGRALAELERSHAARPGDAQVVMFIGNVFKRRGKWDDAVRYYEEAASLDPGWKAPLVNLSQLQLWLRRYDDAERTSRRALSLEPREAPAYTIWASVPLLRSGDVAAARGIVREAAAVTDGQDGMRLPFYIELLDRHYDEALAHLRPELGVIETGDDWLVSDLIRRGVISRLRGDSSAMRADLESARVDLEGRLRDLPRSPQMQNWLRSGLAICYAGLGRRVAALDQARRVLATDPPAVDAISGPAALQDVALAYVISGERTAALDILERLLSIPARFSPQLLRLDPLWDPLRGDPRFERLAHRAR